MVIRFIYANANYMAKSNVLYENHHCIISQHNNEGQQKEYGNNFN